MQILDLYCDVVVPILVILLKKSIEEEVFPELLKPAEVTPLQKKSDTEIIDQYPFFQ